MHTHTCAAGSPYSCNPRLRHRTARGCLSFLWLCMCWRRVTPRTAPYFGFKAFPPLSLSRWPPPSPPPPFFYSYALHSLHVDCFGVCACHHHHPASALTPITPSHTHNSPCCSLLFTHSLDRHVLCVSSLSLSDTTLLCRGLLRRAPAGCVRACVCVCPSAAAARVAPICFCFSSLRGTRAYFSFLRLCLLSHARGLAQLFIFLCVPYPARTSRTDSPSPLSSPSLRYTPRILRR